ncbi:SPOR domain-containing protein [Parabacteroides bouchesdurhonensis]|uniref:SPOR domain-containing protein n=1 Tax=Parabacteroides bouchesdurhonensis TaxID=1936995 RepID=UPI000E4FCFAE|nr:SPOR domain-containing protein [Parabacteroides bouchesdurhonensis]RHJ92947.1 SPOR domain-containing protein [Bacteroides sp. AM07-16]
MKRISCIIFLLFLLISRGGISAQISSEKVTTIFDDLQEPGFRKGQVIVNQSSAIRNLVGARMYGENVEKTDTETFLKVQGFRTQVFSGNNQRKSKDEAFRKEKEIKEMFPDVPTYVTYTAPFWKLRVGDFRSHEEAYHMMRLLMEAFPSYGKEMYIVREEIKIPLN